MASWPTLSRAAVIDDYTCEPSDPTIRTQTADGRPLARDGPGPILRTWRHTLRHLTAADRTLLDTFQFVTVRIGAVPFDWTERISNVTHSVRLARPMIFSLDGSVDQWRTDVVLDEEPAY